MSPPYCRPLPQCLNGDSMKAPSTPKIAPQTSQSALTTTRTRTVAPQVATSTCRAVMLQHPQHQHFMGRIGPPWQGRKCSRAASSPAKPPQAWCQSSSSKCDANQAPGTRECPASPLNQPHSRVASTQRRRRRADAARLASGVRPRRHPARTRASSTRRSRCAAPPQHRQLPASSLLAQMAVPLLLRPVAG